ncbi:MAG: hypothetical protein P8Z81_07250 [Deinococcales bacterium]
MSQAIRPSSTSVAIISVVSDLALEPIMSWVSSVIASDRPASFTPKARA